ncbi:hypothetical protein NLJ89_g12242 [Agrocybe chaxingu]|uniref:Uncharacterized protein n=1 Tax=Agrocybe chaxingu TaxID=84603 RepID=A0A9W8JMN9_9AGAR|nr:hypothetical protein NLJ89_g12242 [Agrocybe chaxingu]
MLLNVLDFRTYTWPGLEDDQAPSEKQKNMMITFDANAVPPQDREGCILARSKALDILLELEMIYMVYDPDNDDVEVPLGELFLDYLNQIGRGLLYYRRQADEAGIDGPSNVTLDLIALQLDRVHVVGSTTYNKWMDTQGLEDEPCGFEFPGSYNIRRRKVRDSQQTQFSYEGREYISEADRRWRAFLKGQSVDEDDGVDENGSNTGSPLKKRKTG